MAIERRKGGNMLKIGEFSKLAQVPVPTLRYYDQVGLLQPVEVDRLTGYRYYSASP
jgi:DNA-binding transcriptional MerR regulator